jgi:hypothetical protein
VDEAFHSAADTPADRDSPGQLERGLLRRVLLDPATGLPNSMYLELLWERQAPFAARHEEAAVVLAIDVAGGTPELRRVLFGELNTTTRAADIVASEGPARVYLLVTVRGRDDLAVIRERVGHAAALINRHHPDAPPLVLHLETVPE